MCREVYNYGKSSKKASNRRCVLGKEHPPTSSANKAPNYIKGSDKTSKKDNLRGLPSASLVPDYRPLPFPEPYDKYHPQPSRNSRYKDEWTWDSWKDWLWNCWGRVAKSWRKKQLRRVLNLRDADPCNTSMNWTRVEGLWSLQGWIYGLYHLASGRWYVGQTIRQIWVRGREHWNQRKTCHDMLHQALSNELTPFAFVIIPLEKIPNWQYFSPQRDETRRLFRQFATPRERYWTGRINSLWPQGFNSAFPGFPVSAWRRRVWRVPEKDSLELHEEEVNEVGRQVSSWLQRLRKEGSSALLELKKWDKFKLRETLGFSEMSLPLSGKPI